MANIQETVHLKSNLTASKDFQKRSTKKREQHSFAKQEIDVKAYILAPEGYEIFMFIIYFLSIPYLFGLSFLYLFVAHGSFENFLNFKISSFFVIWAIGYEVVAAIMLAAIFYSFIKSFRPVA